MAKGIGIKPLGDVTGEDGSNYFITVRTNVARAAGADPTNALRRFPRLTSDAPHERLLIDDVLDALE